MAAILLDTHAWVWSFQNSERLSSGAKEAIVAASARFVSPISFFEIAQKVRLGKWPAMTAHITKLPALLAAQGVLLASLEPAISIRAGMMDWDHRDPFDRMIAATAQHYGLALISADTVFDGVVARNW